MTTDPTPHTERAAAAAAELHDQYSLNWIKELAPMKTERPDLYEFYEKRFLGAEKERERMAAIIAKHFNDDAAKRIAELENAIRWALGEIGSFPPREEGQGKYWWRTELRRRAALSAALAGPVTKTQTRYGGLCSDCPPPELGDVPTRCDCCPYKPYKQNAALAGEQKGKE